MRTIIAGSRTMTNYDVAALAIDMCPWEITTIISGGAKGVDSLGEIYAFQHNIPLEVINAEWEKYGKSAGVIRNEKMAEVAEAVIIIWDGVSRGTANMIENAKRKNLKMHLVMV
jgi:hypothetical protein